MTIITRKKSNNRMTEAFLKAMQNAVDRGDPTGKVGTHIVRSTELRSQVELRRPILTLKKEAADSAVVLTKSMMG
jgi:hypothetical protein